MNLDPLKVQRKTQIKKKRQTLWTCSLSSWGRWHLQQTKQRRWKTCPFSVTYRLSIVGSNRTFKAAPTTDCQHNISFQNYLKCFKPNAKHFSQTFSASKTAPPHLGQASPSGPLQEGSQFRRGGHNKTPQNFEMIKMFKVPMMFNESERFQIFSC